MVICVRHTMLLDYPDQEGTSLRDRLAHIYDSTGNLDDRLKEPEVPAQVQHILEWFWELRNATGGSGFGPSPISFSEIKAWAELTRNAPSLWEVKILRRLDIEYLSFCSEQEKKKMKAAKTSQQLGNRR